MPVQMILCSHSPLMLVGMDESRGDAQQRFKSSMDEVARELHAFNPDVVLAFGPDHFNGFFYDLMPQFCIGLAAEGTQDWGIAGGPFNVPKELADACARHLHAHDFDIAISHEMKIDHGSTISLMQLAGALDKYPVLPIFVNCAADPRPRMARVRALGEEIGRFLSSQDLRVAVIGSGGLSHDPPTPKLATAPADVARRLIRRAVPTADELKAREARVVKFARALVVGEGPCMAPDPEWDAGFMRKIIDFDTAALDAIDDAEIDARAGFGGHEVRTWVAASAAAHVLAGAGRVKARQRYYEVIPEWLTGMGVVTGQA